MGMILSIEWVEKWDKDGVEHARTHAIVDSKRFDIIEVTGYGDDYFVGEEVNDFFHESWDKGKMEHKKSKPVDNSK